MAPQREWFEKDYYEVLGVAVVGDREGHPKRVPEAREGVPPRREPRRRRGRGALQGGVGGARRARRRREAQGVRRGPRDGRERRRARRLRRVRARRVRAAGSSTSTTAVASATSSATCSGAAAGGRRGRGRGTGRSARSAGRTSRPSCTSTSSTPCTASPPRVRSRPSGLLGVRRVGRGARHVPGDVPDLWRHGRGRGGPGPVLVLPGVPDVRRTRPDRQRHVQEVQGQRRRAPPREVKVRIPAGVQRRPAHPGEGTRRRRAQRRAARRPLRGRARGPSPVCSDAPGKREPHGARADHVRRGGARARRSRCRRSTGPVTVKVPPGTQSGTRCRCAGRGITPAKGDAGDLLVTFDVVVPTSSRPTSAHAVEALARDAAAEPARAPGGVSDG